jgi:hypothetical protein
MRRRRRSPPPQFTGSLGLYDAVENENVRRCAFRLHARQEFKTQCNQNRTAVTSLD